MLNKKQTTRIYTNRCLSDCPYYFIARANDPKNDFVRIVMTYLNDYEEKLLDKRQHIVISRGALKFNVHPQYVVAYGDLDLSPNSSDIQMIERTGAFDRHSIRIFMPSEYNYETHTVTSDRPAGRWYETDWCITFLPFVHGCLNKPVRSIIFKEYFNYAEMSKDAKRKARQQKWYNDTKDERIAKMKQYREMRKKEKQQARIRQGVLKLNIKRK